MMRTPVPHPEVDETLYVEECVVRVACPQCRVAAGTPCKGARFDWLARGERRGFRYIQGTHYARRDLFRDWKQSGSPGRLPPSVIGVYETTFGSGFPRRVDRKTRLEPTPLRKSGPRGERKSSPRKEAKKTAPAPWVVVEHRGCRWEGIEGNHLLTWRSADGESYGLFEYEGTFRLKPPHPKHAKGYGYEHECDSQIEAFDLAIELAACRGFLDTLNARASWRIGELERRFGNELE